MEQQTPITFIINGRTYTFHRGSDEAIRDMPPEDRQQLISLLEVVKEQERLARAAVDAAANRVLAAAAGVSAGEGAASPQPERLGSGDVDALMARLVMEDQRNRKSPVSRGSLYKWTGICVGIVLLLALIV